MGLNVAIVFTAQQQLELLEGRKKQYMKAALQAKQKKDLEQAKTLLRTAKGLEPLIEAARSGKTVDISKVRLFNYAFLCDYLNIYYSLVMLSEFHIAVG